MICTCIDHRSYYEICGIISRRDVELAEIRLDSCSVSTEEIVSIFSTSSIPLIATCRISICGDESICGEKLSAAIEAGADFVDLEIEASQLLSSHIIALARGKSCRIIRSYHNFSTTPSIAFLMDMVAKCKDNGADIVKIVTTAASAEDASIIKRLYTESPLEKGHLIAFLMGESAKDTRSDALSSGAPFTYCSLSDECKTADGQMCYSDYKKELFGSFHPFYRDISDIPSSKSYAQRAIIAAALTSGRSIIRNFSPCDDSLSAINVAKSLGAAVSISGSVLEIEGSYKNSCPGCLSVIHAGESGLLARMMIPLMSQLRGESFIVTGEKSLLSRELKGVREIMSLFGVEVKGLSSDKTKLPVSVSRKLTPCEAEIDGSNGSQLITGLLMALPLADAPSKLTVHNPKSVPYLNMTLQLLQSFGIEIEWGEFHDDLIFDIAGRQTYRACSLDLEADWSGAANFLVAGALFGGVSIDNLHNASLQADRYIIDILKLSGAKVSWDGNTVSVYRAPLSSFDVSLDNAPDIIPIVSLLAAFCPGRSTIRGAERLKDKESDRARSIYESLTKLGVHVSVGGNTITIDGESLSSRLADGHLLHGGEFSSYHDHRIAMMLKVASIAATSEIVIDDIRCMDKSFPSFSFWFDM